MVSFCLTKSCIVSNNKLGRSLGIVPYSVAKEGFIDLDQDDFLVGEEMFLAKFQNNVFNLRGDDWQ